MASSSTITGVYRKGVVEIPRDVHLAEGTQVLVTVPGTPSAGTMITLGMFSGPPFTTDQDFKDVEWHGESGSAYEDDDDSRH
jgi:hypothetical protein